jgi:hypothetical protein
VIRITGLFEVGGEVTGVLESPRELVASLHETPTANIIRRLTDRGVVIPTSLPPCRRFGRPRAGPRLDDPRRVTSCVSSLWSSLGLIPRILTISPCQITSSNDAVHNGRQGE